MKYIVYLTTNLKSKINGVNKIYVGVHQTENPEIFDGYIGCGVYIQKPSTYMYPKTPFQYAVKKYGVNAFKREILYIYDTSEEAFTKEIEIVDSQFISQDHTYNCALGGIGGSLKGLNPKIHSLPINQFNLNGKLIKTWKTTLDACDFYGYDYGYFSWAIVDHNEFLESYWSRDNTIDIKTYGSNLLKVTYLYSKFGKLLTKFKSRTECAEFLGCASQSVSNAVRNNNPIKGYYVSDKLLDEYKPKPRLKLQNTNLFLYHVSDGYLGKFVGKEIMPVIGLHSFSKISSAINDNRGWYKDFYISLFEIDCIPEKYTHNKKIEIYTKTGELIEVLNSVKEVKEKYNLNSAEMNRILKGVKQHENYIFKYSK